MFISKERLECLEVRIELLEKQIRKIEQDLVSCEDCGCLLRRDNSCKVDFICDYYGATMHYCVDHKKPYTKVTNYSQRKRYFGDNIELTEDGKVIKK
jgi:hypothetical protein